MDGEKNLVSDQRLQSESILELPQIKVSILIVFRENTILPGVHLFIHVYQNNLFYNLRVVIWVRALFTCEAKPTNLSRATAYSREIF